MTVKNIVFDLGNVIMKYDVDAMLERFSLTFDEKELFKSRIFFDEKWKDGDRGFSFRDVLFYDTVKEFSPKMKQVFYSLVARYDFELEFMEFNKGIDDIIAELKQNGYSIYLLSNFGLNFHFLRNKVPVFSLFDGFFASCDYGIIKPEKEIYEEFFRKFSLNPSECLFIDDSKENTVASCANGMDAFMYNALFEDTDVLRSRLQSRGINIGN